MFGQDTIRTRFAPSPTGYMHIGNLRTALYAYLLAKSTGGTFILRIEDTDQERLVEDATEIIYSTLRLSGIVWDEGPDIGGPCGPYIQSERREIYQKYAEQLIEGGFAYRCFCGKEELGQGEKGVLGHKYDGRCKRLTQEQIQKNMDAGLPFVVRQAMPAEGSTTFVDEVYGSITVENSELEDHVLIKSDSLPTYNFANVVDDHLMGITHVIRGSEYLSSTPKYNLLYEAFGWAVPKYIHCPPIMKDAHQKLSKRNGDASFQDLIAKGLLPEAVLNYIALLGWNPGTEQEIFTADELCRAFSIEGISKSPAIFDPVKLAWMNGEYLRALPLETFTALATPFLRPAIQRTDIDFSELCALLQGRSDVLENLPLGLEFIDALPDYSTDLFKHKKMKTNRKSSLTALQALLEALSPLEDWTAASIHDAVFALVEKMGVKNGQVLWPLRVAVSGTQVTPGGGIELSALLGKQDTLDRIQVGIKKIKTSLQTDPE